MTTAVWSFVSRGVSAMQTLETGTTKWLSPSGTILLSPELLDLCILICRQWLRHDIDIEQARQYVIRMLSATKSLMKVRVSVSYSMLYRAKQLRSDKRSKETKMTFLGSTNITVQVRTSYRSARRVNVPPAASTTRFNALTNTSQGSSLTSSSPDSSEKCDFAS